MEILIVGIVIFVISALIIELSIYAFKNIRYPNRAEVKKRLRKFSYKKSGNDSTDIIRKRILSDIPWFNKILNVLPGVPKLDRLIQQANLQYPVGIFLLFSALLITFSYITCSLYLMYSQFFSMIIALLTGCLPFIFIVYMKQQRIQKFRNNFPEALGLIARSLKAGHSFASGLKLVADEFDDPIGPEFEETLDAVNFGVSIQNALKDMAERLDCPEIRYFIVAVILQRETGGNLAENIESLANLIRERQKLDGKIKALAAEGKLSAIILIALPFFVVAYVRMVNPGYMKLLFSDPVGIMMVKIALGLMVVGIFIIKKMIDIKW